VRHPRGGDEVSGALAAETSPVHDPVPVPPPEGPRRQTVRAPAGTAPPPPHPTSAPPATEDRETERGLRGLVGAGSSQVSVTAAMRARDAARPTDADLASAETDLVIVKRGWVPRDPLTSVPGNPR